MKKRLQNTTIKNDSSSYFLIIYIAINIAPISFQTFLHFPGHFSHIKIHQIYRSLIRFQTIFYHSQSLFEQRYPPALSLHAPLQDQVLICRLCWGVLQLKWKSDRFLVSSYSLLIRTAIHTRLLPNLYQYHLPKVVQSQTSRNRVLLL